MSLDAAPTDCVYWDLSYYLYRLWWGFENRVFFFEDMILKRYYDMQIQLYLSGQTGRGAAQGPWSARIRIKKKTLEVFNVMYMYIK